MRDLREALVDAQTLHNEMIVEGRGDDGRALRFIASPIGMSGAGASVRKAPPTLGQHTEEVLAEAQRLVAGAAT